jgi:cell wall-associated NlpC family hydrolase
MTAMLPAVGAMARINEIRARFEPRPVAAPATTAAPTSDLAAVASGRDFYSMLLDASGSTTAPRAAAAGPATGLGDAVVRQGTTYLGVPYVWGGTDPNVGLDCSGFVQRVHRDLGIELPRVSRDQAKGGQPVASLAEARPGDVLAFGQPVNHVAIYAGDGMMIHAPRRGDVVTMEPIDRPITAIRRYTGAAPVTSGWSGPRCRSGRRPDRPARRRSPTCSPPPVPGTGSIPGSSPPSLGSSPDTTPPRSARPGPGASCSSCPPPRPAWGSTPWTRRRRSTVRPAT